MGRSSPTDPRRHVRLSRALARGGAWLAVVALAGCIELATFADISFPNTVPGLPADQPWVSLPVRRWLTDREVEPMAISACIGPNCRHQAAVGLFLARGEAGAALARAATNPGALVAMLMSERPSARVARGRKPPIRAQISAEPAREGGLPGFIVRLSRPDGVRSAFGYVAARQSGGTTHAVVIVAPNEGAARELARGVVPALGN